jgi:hypothetical protein
MGGRQRPTLQQIQRQSSGRGVHGQDRTQIVHFRQQVAAFRHVQRLGYKLGNLKEAEARVKKASQLLR